MNPVIKSAGKVFPDDPEKACLPLPYFCLFILSSSLTSRCSILHGIPAFQHFPALTFLCAGLGCENAL